MTVIARLMIAAAIAWPTILGASLLARMGGAMPVWTTVVYTAAGLVCHQRPERSFHTRGVKWPVCARCTGLYLSAPVGALCAWRRRRSLSSARVWRLLAVTALPTAATLALEWSGLAATTNLMRALCALPLGAALAFVLVSEANEPPQLKIVD